MAGEIGGSDRPCQWLGSLRDRSLAAFLDGQHRGRSGNALRVRHETEWQEMAADVLSGRCKDIDARLERFAHEIEVSPVVAMLPCRPLPHLPLIGIVRDGRGAVRSGFETGWYSNPRRAPLHWTKLQPTFAGDRFERCCQFWTWSNKRVELWGGRMFRLEDLVASHDARSKLLSCLGLETSQRGRFHTYIAVRSTWRGPSPRPTGAGGRGFGGMHSIFIAAS